MNTDVRTAATLAREVVDSIKIETGDVKVAVCPPFMALDGVFNVIHGTAVRLGAQNMHFEDEGAFTGEVSAPMLRSVGCHYVILGHSERRSYFGETDEAVNAKVRAALTHKLVPIVCVGETLAERDAGKEKSVVEKQVEIALTGVRIESGAQLVVAYEPVWAIGTGRTATPQQAQAMHECIRALLSDRFGATTAGGIDLLYGGSMKPANAAELLSQQDVDGGLIGGASLRGEDFAAIVSAAVSASEA